MKTKEEPSGEDYSKDNVKLRLTVSGQATASVVTQNVQIRHRYTASVRQMWLIPRVVY